MSNELVKVSQILAFDKPFENVKNIWIGEDNDIYFEFTSGKITNYYQTDYEIVALKIYEHKNSEANHDATVEDVENNCTLIATITDKTVKQNVENIIVDTLILEYYRSPRENMISTFMLRTSLGGNSADIYVSGENTSSGIVKFYHSTDATNWTLFYTNGDAKLVFQYIESYFVYFKIVCEGANAKGIISSNDTIVVMQNGTGESISPRVYGGTVLLKIS